MMSLPALALILSLPPLPQITSLPDVPSKTSSPDVPVIVQPDACTCGVEPEVSEVVGALLP
ncbi:unannotated protein [freshwater metagenome]|uniref:Unannotated protein n=1 Tax=freshwater metagenome TaxID=449393 RepID=A0A6J6UN56_9ZZZZ